MEQNLAFESLMEGAEPGSASGASGLRVRVFPMGAAGVGGTGRQKGKRQLHSPALCLPAVSS